MDDRHAQVSDQPAWVRPGIQLSKPLFRSGEADAEALDLSEPSLALGLYDAGADVAGDFRQPGALGRVRSQE